MTAISVHVNKQLLNAPRFRATLGDRQSVGRTMGEALDALTADWDDTLQEADVQIESIPDAEAGVEPHLVEINGVWVIAGGPVAHPGASERDYVSEMREERDRSFYAHYLPENTSDESSS